MPSISGLGVTLHFVLILVNHLVQEDIEYELPQALCGPRIDRHAVATEHELLIECDLQVAAPIGRWAAETEYPWSSDTERDVGLD